MKKIPYKVRLWLSIGLFIWSIVAFVASIVYYASTKQLWIIIAIPIIAIISFVLSIVFFPRFKDDGSSTAKPKQNSQKTINSKSRKSKKPFISEKEWKELDEEDEECMYIDEDNQ